MRYRSGDGVGHGSAPTIVTDLAGVDAQARSLCDALEKDPLATVCETTRASAVRSFPEAERPVRNDALHHQPVEVGAQRGAMIAAERTALRPTRW